MGEMSVLVELWLFLKVEMQAGRGCVKLPNGALTFLVSCGSGVLPATKRYSQRIRQCGMLRVVQLLPGIGALQKYQLSPKTASLAADCQLLILAAYLAFILQALYQFYCRVSFFKKKNYIHIFVSSHINVTIKHSDLAVQC